MTNHAAGRLGWASRKLTVDLGLLLTAIIWGINFPLVKLLLGHLEPLAFNALRFPFAALALFVLLRATGRPVFPPRAEWGRVAALGLVGHAAFQILFIYGIDATRTGNAALLLSTSPVWVVAIGGALGRERLSLGIVWGVTTTVAGMAILVVGGGQELGQAGVGDLLVLGAAVAWAAYTVFGYDITRRRGALSLTAWAMWPALPVLVGAGVPGLARADWGAVPVEIWLGTIYTGVFGIALAYLLWSRGVRAIGQSRTAVYQNLVPVVALGTAWLWLAEVPSEGQVAGAVVILAGVAVTRGVPGVASPGREAEATGDGEGATGKRGEPGRSASVRTLRQGGGAGAADEWREDAAGTLKREGDER